MTCIISSYLPFILRSCIEILSLFTLLFIDSAMTETMFTEHANVHRTAQMFTEPRKCSQNRTYLAEVSLVIFRLPIILFTLASCTRLTPYVSQCVHECSLKSPQWAHAFPRLASTWYKTFYNYRLKNLP